MNLRKNEKIQTIVEGEMIVAKGESYHIPSGMLMELYSYHGYESDEAVRLEGGEPQRIKVRLIVAEEVL